MRFSYSYPENPDNSRPLQVINVDDERIQQREGSVDGKIVNVILNTMSSNLMVSPSILANCMSWEVGGESGEQDR